MTEAEAVTGRLVEQLAGFDSNLTPPANKHARSRANGGQCGASVSERPPATHVMGAANAEQAAANVAGNAQEVRLSAGDIW